MKDKMDSSQFLFYQGDPPKGLDYINWIFSKDDIKETKTFEKFKKDTVNNSLQTYEALGDLLGMLYKLAVCGYGCHGGDHKIEYITGRTYNLAISSLKLLRLGHYDESLSLIRSISEIINLLCLFRIDPKAYSEWTKCNQKDRIQKFGPAKVRTRITKIGPEPPISQEYYSKLCETGVHVTPDTVPSGYNEHKLALVGGIIIEYAPTAILNDLTNNVFWTILMASSNILSKDEFMGLTDELKPYQEKIGELTITNLDDYVQKNKPSEKRTRDSNSHQHNA
jgi:hypothetical protein